MEKDLNVGNQVGATAPSTSRNIETIFIVDAPETCHCALRPGHFRGFFCPVDNLDRTNTVPKCPNGQRRHALSAR